MLINQLRNIRKPTVHELNLHGNSIKEEYSMAPLKYYKRIALENFV